VKESDKLREKYKDTPLFHLSMAIHMLCTFRKITSQTCMDNILRQTMEFLDKKTKDYETCQDDNQSDMANHIQATGQGDRKD